MLLQVAGQAGSLELFKLESSCILVSHILLVAQAEYILRQVDQLLVVRIVEIGYDRYSIIQLEAERVDRIVHQDDVPQVSVADDTQVFDEDALVRLEAVLAVESEVYQSPVGVDKVQHCVSVLSVTRCEDSHLVLRGTLGQALSQMWSQVDPCLNRGIFLVWTCGPCCDTFAYNCHSVLWLLRE